MEKDYEGFEYPFIDSSKCVRCYLCVHVCPFKLELYEVDM
ncbi:MAG: 4Fe-4S binding protein [Lachnobacterium sp.]|nr:4Fe-4S binding protein [Lachnobacterium sp.]